MRALDLIWTRLARFRRPPHIAPWGGDYAQPWLPLWEPDPKGQIR